METTFLLIAFYDKNKLADLLGNNNEDYKELYKKMLVGKNLFFNNQLILTKYNSLDTCLMLLSDEIKTFTISINTPFKIILHSKLPPVQMLSSLKKSTFYTGEIREIENENSIWDFIIHCILQKNNEKYNLKKCWDKIPNLNKKLIKKINKLNTL